MADGGGPTEQDRSEGMPSFSEAPNVRGKSAWLLGVGPRRLLQVTRRQGGILSRRYRRNGYVPNPNPNRNRNRNRNRIQAQSSSRSRNRWE